MKTPLIVGILVVAFLISCNGQSKKENEPNFSPNSTSKKIGGNCEDCELMYVDIPIQMSSVDTNAAWNEKGQKLTITGTIFEIDGKTPAKNVIVYYWQTDADGYYISNSTLNKQATRHGHLRGWIKTDATGKYTINTIRPAPYPNRDIPAHIHLLIKEPDIESLYYLDDLVFDDDPLLIPYRKKYPFENRGGSGILRLIQNKDIQIAEHNIVLGLNVPNYPKKVNATINSGLPIGEEQPSFLPFHAFGADKGSTACPVCKYGRYHGILYFVGANSNWNEIRSWLAYMELESAKRKKQLKVYFVCGNAKNYTKETRQKELEQLGTELNLKNVALTFVPSFSDSGTEVNRNKINPEVDNTIIIYKHRVIIDKYINLQPTERNFKMISSVLDETKGDYFDLPEPRH